MKPIKTLLLLVSILVFSARGYSQFVPLHYEVTAGQCYADSAANPNGGMLDSIQVLNGPDNGTFTVTNQSFVYCPDANFVGYDTVYVYACAPTGGMIQCGNFMLVLNVYVPCNIVVTLQQNLGAVCAGGNRAYDAIVSGGTAPYTYLWSDGSTTMTACEPGPNQNICVAVTDANGCANDVCSSPNGGCQLNISITHSASGCGMVGDALTVNVSGGTAPYTFYWSNNSTAATICGLTPGTYSVAVVDAQGCQANATYTIQGNGSCYFTYSNTPVDPYKYYFESQGGNSPISWHWTFHDGGGSTTANPFKIYPGPGNYLVTLVTYYANGDSCTYSNYVYVPNDSINYPQCQAYFSNYLDNNGTFHFVDYSSYNPSTWLWSFGDGTSSTLQHPTHTYNSTGTWTVCLTTTDANGCSSNYCQQIDNIPVQDLQAFLYHQTSTTPGFPIWVSVGYYNSGTVLVNGTVEYRYPVGTTVNATSIVPASHDVVNRLLTFNFTGSLPGTSGHINIDLDASASLSLGALSEDTLWVNPITGDATPANNVSVVMDSVTGSWDPNDKAVSPKGEGNHGVVPLATNTLSYRIRFQNTGTAQAHDVIIRDALSNHIDLSTVKVTAASHEHTFEMIGNQLVVTFANIQLPDSGADYTASQGYIDVHVQLKPGLALGTQVFNTAEIYFDFNAPVITNTVTNTLGELVSGIEAIESIEFTMLPNPASTQVTVRGEFNNHATFELMNQLGQTLLTGPVNTNNTTLNVADLSSGIYLVRIKSGQKAAVQKLIITK